MWNVTEEVVMREVVFTTINKNTQRNVLIRGWADGLMSIDANIGK